VIEQYHFFLFSGVLIITLLVSGYEMIFSKEKNEKDAFRLLFIVVLVLSILYLVIYAPGWGK
jgi:hypothetical protein